MEAVIRSPPRPRRSRRPTADRLASPMVTERDFYEVLGVDRSASDADIKRAFRKLAQQWHPDVSTEPGAPERFKEINEAYQVLSDPQRRQTYDMFGRAGRRRVGRRRAVRRRGRVRRLRGHLRRRLRRRRRAAQPARRPDPGLGPPVRPPDHVRGGGPRGREGDRVPGPRPVRHVPGHRREGRLDPRPVPAVQRSRRDPVGPPDDARPDGQRRPVPALPGRGQGHRGPVRRLSAARAARSAGAASG